MSSRAGTGRWFALASWIVGCGAVTAHQIDFWSEPRIDTDITALLPSDAGDPAAARAAEHFGRAAEGVICVLIGSPDWETTRAAAQRFRASLSTGDASEPSAVEVIEAPSLSLAALLADLRPFRDRFLSGGAAERLNSTPSNALGAEAMAGLYGPPTRPRLLSFGSDPLGLSSEWLLGQAANAPVQPRDGELYRHADGLEWALVRLRAVARPFALDGTARLAPLLDLASEAARSQGPHLVDVRVVRAGVPLYAEAAAVQASHEVSTIGLGSTLAIVILVLVVFRGVRPLLLVSLSLVVGISVGLSTVAFVFGRVHLITFIFGASLVGVAEDYGIHFFTARYEHPSESPFETLRRILPGLFIALLTSVVAYAALGVSPLPGLRQMAVFSATGLTGAFLTVTALFPWLAGRPRPPGKLGRALGRSLAWFPRLGPKNALWFAVVGILVLAPGLWKLEVRDDLRALGRPPANLVEDQQVLGRVLGVESPAQFFLVTGESEDELLAREEALGAVLVEASDQGHLVAHRRVSSWCPSRAVQAANALIHARVVRAVGDALATQLGEPGPSLEPVSSRAMTLSDWHAAPAVTAIADLFLGQVGDRFVSIVTLGGLAGQAGLYAIADMTHALAGVRLLDRTRSTSDLMAMHRGRMLIWLAVGHVLVFGVLLWRFGRTAWRAHAPTVLAVVAACAALGYAGEPLQLFSVLALTLLTGMGVDYGVFLCEHRETGAENAWLSINVGAASTLLAFGLLALSATPALHVFGLTMLVGIGTAWLATPLFRS